MKIRFPKATKAELIMFFLNNWNPLHAAEDDFWFYKIEAEEIAQVVRKNSSYRTIEKAVRESVLFRMEFEKMTEPFDEEGCKECVELIMAALKQQ